jgi:hypothetical protein
MTRSGFVAMIVGSGLALGQLVALAAAADDTAVPRQALEPYFRNYTPKWRRAGLRFGRDACGTRPKLRCLSEHDFAAGIGVDPITFLAVNAGAPWLVSKFKTLVIARWARRRAEAFCATFVEELAANDDTGQPLSNMEPREQRNLMRRD